MAAGLNVAFSIKGSAVKEVSIGNSQNQGRRSYQEDSFGFTDLDAASVAEKGFIAMVSDGMGGLTASDAVSAYTISAIQQMYRMSEKFKAPNIAFKKLVNAINNTVANEGSGGGATLVAALCSNEGVYWCSVGDSRIYLFRNGRIYQLTQDLDYINILLDKVIDGEMTYEEADNAPKRDSLAEYIGSGEELHLDVNVKPFIPESGDKLLLCSDGVYNALSADELSNLLCMGAQESANAITNAVLAKQYENQDNFTSIVIEFK